MMAQDNVRVRLRSLCQDALALAATALLVVCFYWPRLSPTASFILGDGLDQNVPHRVYAARIVQTGRLPEWSDMTFGGYPFLSDPQTAVFFPPFLAMELAGWIPDTSPRFDALAFSFILFCGLGATLLARSVGTGVLGAVAAGVFFALNGYMVDHLGHTVITSAIAAAVWGMAFVVAALRRQSNRALWAAGLFFASSILAGHWQEPMFAFYATAAGGLYLVVRAAAAHRRLAWAGRDVVRLAAILAIAVAGAAVQILPTLEFLRHSTRERLSFDSSAAYSLPLAQLAGLLMPGLYQPLFWRVPLENRWDLCWHTWGMDGAWEFEFWIGIMAVALILFGLFATARRPSSWLLAGCFVFVLVAAMGHDFKLYQHLFFHAPGFRQIRIPPRMMWVGYLAGALLIARGVDAVAALPPWPWRRWGARLAALGMLALAGVMLYLLGWALWLAGGWLPALEMLLVINPNYRIGVDRTVTDFLTDVELQALVGAAFFAAALVWLWAAARVRRWRWLPATAAIALIWAELGVYGFYKNISIGNPGFTTAVTPKHALIGDRVTGRLHPMVIGPWEKNTGEASGIPTTTGYNPMILKWVDYHFPPEEPTNGRRWRENLLDVWNASHVVAPGGSSQVALPGSGKVAEMTTGTGSIFLARGTDEFTSGASFALKGERVARVVVLAGAMGVAGEPDGTTVGVVRLLGADGEEATSFPLRLGMETAEWTYRDAQRRVAPAHREPPLAFTETEWRDAVSSATSYYLASVDVPSSVAVRGVRVESALAWPRWLAVAGVIEETTGGEVIAHPAVEGLGYEPVPSRDPRWWIYYRRPTPPGWAWLVPEARPVSYKSGYRDLRAHLQRSDWDARHLVLVEKRAFDSPAQVGKHNAADPAGFRGSVDVEHPYPEFWRIRTHSNDRGWLFVSKTWYTGWRGTLDGQPVKLVRADGPFTALPVPEGEHIVELRYATPWLWLGAPISALVWIAGLIGMLTGWGPPRRRMSAPGDSQDSL
jgi:hypothetical protein